VRGEALRLGGPDATRRGLDSSSTLPQTTGREQPTSRAIGQYAHGNERPSHSYLYALVDSPGRPSNASADHGQRCTPPPRRIDRHEDCGQMERLVHPFALGSSVCPGRPDYVVGTPLFPRARSISTTGGSLVIGIPGRRAGAPYIPVGGLNGEPSSARSSATMRFCAADAWSSNERHTIDHAGRGAGRKPSGSSIRFPVP